MMWTLPLPDNANAATELAAALTYANGTPVYALSAAERAAVLAVYHAYDALGGQPGAALTPAALGAACYEAIKEAYNEVQQHRRLENLRGRLLAATDSCPCCGFGEPTQLDHYLPKSVYKALAVYARNLVPCCGPCNTMKKALTPQQTMRLVHAYFAELPDEIFLVADVAMPAGGLKVTYRIDADGIEPDLAAALRFQLNRLRLNKRYPKQINTYLFAQKTAIRKLTKTGGAALLEEFLLEAAEDQRGDFGRNDWRPALLEGLARCHAFLHGGAAAYFQQGLKAAGAAV